MRFFSLRTLALLLVVVCRVYVKSIMLIHGLTAGKKSEHRTRASASERRFLVNENFSTRKGYAMVTSQVLAYIC